MTERGISSSAIAAIYRDEISYQMSQYQNRIPPIDKAFNLHHHFGGSLRSLPEIGI